jgi:hypothetical protein
VSDAKPIDEVKATSRGRLSLPEQVKLLRSALVRLLDCDDLAQHYEGDLPAGRGCATCRAVTAATAALASLDKPEGN